MAITVTLKDEAVNDQTAQPQTSDNSDHGLTDTDVVYSPLPATSQTYLETTLGLNSTLSTLVDLVVGRIGSAAGAEGARGNRLVPTAELQAPRQSSCNP
jgi:hypothetical protein